MQPLTLNDIFLSVVDRKSERVMLAREGRVWNPISSQELYRCVTGMVRALSHWGVSEGDRVAILSENRPEWAMMDFASLLLGAVVVPIYTTLIAHQIAYILRDSGAKVVAVSTQHQLKKVLEITSQTAVKKIVVMDSVEAAETAAMQPLMQKGATGRDLELERRARAITPDHVASIIYTSGTTGVPKGVQLTHENLTSNIMNSLAGFELRPGQVSVSFLPLSHVTARHADLALLYRGVTLAYCPFIEQMPQVLQEVKPNIFIAVPRVYEKIYQQVELQAKGVVKRSVYRWAVSVGRAHRADILRGLTPRSFRWRLANKLIFSKVRTRLGGQVEIFVSGGAPLGKELAEWYTTIGIPIYEGYGLTETSPVIAINNPGAHKTGTVGQPLPNVQVQLADDREILVRGPSVFRSYWNSPEDNQTAFVNGWFKTGDIGEIDADGFLTVIDRKKDLIKTSGGKFIAPQPLESSLKLNGLVGTALVLGDRRKFASVIISPHFPQLEEWARVNQIPFSSRESLINRPEVRALYDDIVSEVNRSLARYETIKKVLLVPEEFTANDGSLTPTLKLRRRAIEERYRQQIDELYREPSIGT